eukprot:PITA_19935
MRPDRFRPIALSNVVYKIISKVIANRLKPLLPALVLEEQTGFVEGRQILNNIIQAHEVVLRAYGFDHNWIRWVMSLVSTVSFSILLNGSPSRTFMPSRDLRQGDPLSPFLFVLMMEGLGRAIKMENVEGRIQGLKLTPDGATTTHQQFVDDTMLQSTPMVKEARAFKQILNNFALATEKKKWALVAWEKLCKPKAHGGLGLHDPEILSRVSGSKLWWRWLKESTTPWAKLWKQKYAINWQERDHIIMSRLINGSHIWNLSWENKAIIQQHSFWEIRDGNLARFWEDNWQQEPNLFRE